MMTRFTASCETPNASSPPRLPPGPDQRATSEDPLKYLETICREWGGAVRFPTGYGPVLLFNDPELVRTLLQSTNFQRTSLFRLPLGDGLLASEGDHWREQRRLMQPHFHQEPIARMVPLIERIATQTMERWEGIAERGEPLNVSEEMTLLTLGVIVRALFTSEIGDPVMRELNMAITTMMDTLGGIVRSMVSPTLRIETDHNAKVRAGLDTIDRIVGGIVEARRATAPEARPPDLLTLLLSTQEGTGADAVPSDRQIRDEVVTMLVAGHETTAVGLAWTWLLLAGAPEAEARMHAEIDAVLGDRAPAMADLPKLAWTRQVFQESMRLYPPVWVIIRRAQEAEAVGPWTVPAGATVMVSMWPLHRNPEYWPDPEKFDPERFAPEAVAARHRFAYIPFGAGPHRCIGEGLAMMEAALIMTAVARRFRIRIEEREIRPLPVITLRPERPIIGRLERRGVTR